MKKWNWGTFWFILVICALGLAGNENVHSFVQWLVLTLGLGIPFGIITAWMSADSI